MTTNHASCPEAVKSVRRGLQGARDSIMRVLTGERPSGWFHLLQLGARDINQAVQARITDSRRVRERRSAWLQLLTWIPRLQRPGTWYNTLRRILTIGYKGACTMARQCPTCQSLYAAHANYCAVCGLALVSPRGARRPKKAVLALTLMVSALITYAVFAVARPSLELEDRGFHLPPAKAGAMLELLKPRSVKVRVRNYADHIKIKGTANECDILEDFAGLIARHKGKPDCDVRECMKQARGGWTTHKLYKLPNARAKALFRALAPDDVPVLVSWAGKRVRVDATPKDQEVVGQVVEILCGHRQ